MDKKNNNTRQTLISKVANKQDEKSWEEFVNIYRGYIKSFILKMGIEFDEVEDVTQKVLVKLWEKMPDFEYKPGQCRFRSWIAIVSRGILKDHRQLKQNKIRKKADSQNLPDLMVASEVEMIALQEWKDFISNLAWEKVSQRFSKEVLDIFLQCADYSVEEVAQRTNVEKTTVYVYRNRVETAIKKEIYRLNYDLG